MADKKKQRDRLAVFWGDTRELLTKRDYQKILQTALLESVDDVEVLLRDPVSGRLIVVSCATEEGLFCSVCKSDLDKRLGKPCPTFAACVYNGHKFKR